MTDTHFGEDQLSNYNCADGIQRNIHIWQGDNPKAILLCIHGGLSHGGDFQTLGQYFREQQFTCIAPDLTGHVSGDKVIIDSFEQFLDDITACFQWVKNQYPDKDIFIIGHSMGGLIATHLGLGRLQEKSEIKGYILSAPYFHNKIAVHPILQKLSGLASMITPKLTVPLEDFTEQLTHDNEIQKRVYTDINQGYRATKASSRFAHELLTAQKKLPDLMHQWNKDLLIFTAGKDELADNNTTTQLLRTITHTSCEHHNQPENFHENFNETNRNEIFLKILNWAEKRI